ncbi:hypothetical protein JCM19314_150 [Nonlabens ulvanivorans]|uniref:Outer membrane protein beta-barrel domain-containing protein n=1 Tax=Nonlabens ulvanivorans TaxID=906888 RepID=A0A090QGM0_NONUL|nr:DUF6048 family protein [Nonlabens ulvanivorans]GAL00924.1 hypothetical protein JCM19314_150 [Nonlabens ulvanivorans]
MRYVTNILILLVGLVAFSQTQEKTAVDSVQYKRTYGLRLGIDAASLIRTGIDPEYNGFQILADYRIKNKLYIAGGELGNENIDRNSDRIDFKTSGSYFKAGIDYNLYQNWLDMDNMIYFGARLGAANFSQNLLRYDYAQDNSYFPVFTNVVDREFKGLTAVWLELQLGIKVEVLPNLYMVANVQLKRMITEKTPDNFDNLYVPGFGKTYDTSEIGVGYTYGLMYRIPFFKK